MNEPGKSKEVTTKQVRAVRFSVYSEEEVKKLSVVRILQPITRNALKEPVPQGLYDTAMGPVDKTSTMMHRLVRCTCLFCFHLKLQQPQVEKYEARFKQLAFGDLAAGIETHVAKTFTHKLLGGLLDHDMDEEEYASKSHAAPECKKDSKVSFTQHALEATQDTLTTFWASCSTKAKCMNCGATNPSIRKFGTKLFMVWTSPKALVTNAMNNHIMPNLLDEGVSVIADMEAQVAAEISKQASARATVREKKKRGLPVDQKSVRQAADDDSADPVDRMMEEAMTGQEDEELYKDEDSDAEDEMGIKAGVAQMEIDQAEDTLALMADMEEGGKKRDKKSLKAAAYDAATRAALASPTGPKFITSSEAMTILARLWRHEAPVLNLIFAASSPAALGLGAGQVSAVPSIDLAAFTTYRMFFLSVLSVSPNKFRPPSKLGEDEFEHIQNASYIKILNACLDINTTVSEQNQAYTNARLAATEIDPTSLAIATAKQDLGRVIARWLELQNSVCELMDTSTTEKKTDALGIRQQIEKKEGLFRKNMMGKRVNFAARSVISPDPYIGTGEIGVPPYFAKRLTFAERVTPFNVERLRQAVINGHAVHPGALSVEMENGVVTHLEKLSKQKREAIAKQLLVTTTGGVMSGRQRLLSLGAAATGKQVATSAAAPQTSKIVYRHLQDGDVMLTNRQPTLHKPGLMAHRARVLKGEKTIRMHYANCATFNADFDGDEINLHLPQDQMGRAEGYEIVHADHQFIVPTDGKPVRGLIQDHVVSGTLLAKRDTFFTRQEYSQLLFVGCTVWTSKAQGGTSQAAMQLDPPTILKPHHMWTGKQVIAGVIRFFTRHAGEPLTFIAGSKVPAAYWGLHSGEDELELLNGYLLRGCIDKNQFGKYGLVHAVQELYGGTAAGQLLSAFSRLFTYYLSWHGFTCGFDDLLLVRDAEVMRAAMLEKAETIALKASADFVGQPLSRYVLEKSTEGGARAVANPEVVAAAEEVSTALALRYRNAEETGKAHDIKGSGVMHPLSSEVIKSCLPTGQVKAFPANCLSLMTISGAKGSLVNFSQISCLLGQQELEGRRVPRMSSGKTLPCFRAFDGGARSCGFVGDRFLTGLRPQEYYFHCMAGREGLVDTTVKTSRSGYLQRCMIKNLESLRVHYDNTVRDNADGSVVQMFYGEDGVDVMNINYMSKFEFLAKNAVTFARRLDLPNALLAGKTACLEEAEAEIAAAISERTALKAKAAKAQKDGKLKLAAKTVKQLSLNPPVSALQPPTVMGATSEKFADSLAKFLHDNAGGLLASEERIKDILSQPAVPGRQGVHPVSTETFQQLMQLKYMRSLAAPGEAVGVIAAQSVGEPSTQMTLNTFHMAGRGEANVTLGIPRLREILMAAAKRIRTPVMTVPLLPGLGVQAAGVLAGRMRKLLLAECVSGISVEETPVAALDHAAGSYGRRYRVTLHFYSEDKYPAEAKLSHRELAFCFMKTFCPALQKEVDKESKKKGSVSIGKVDVADLDEELQLPDGGADDEEAAAVEASKSKKKKASKEEAFEDFEGDEELREGKLRFRGGRGESASYAPADDEDEEDNRAAAKEEDKRQAAAWAAASHEHPAEDEEAAAEEGADEEEEEEGEETTEAATKGKKSGSKRGSSAKDGKRRKVTPKAKKAEAAVPVFDLDMKLSGYDGEDDDTDMVPQTDPHSEQSCSVTMTMPLSSPKLLMLELVEKIAAATPVRVTKGIERVYVIEPNASEAAKCQTDGITFPGVWAHSDIVNVNGITTNDVHAMLTTYGVEAARGTLMHEVQSVFAAYGIGVDPRHLSLIADFMTHQGGYRACNRIGISSCVSPLLKMSFETAAAFLTDATLKGSVDDLRSPAARLVVGRVVELGTGVMDLLHDC